MKKLLMDLSTPKKLAALAFILGVFAMLIGNSNNRQIIKVNAQELALSTIKDQDQIDVMTLADWLIKGNSDFTLVDLRTDKEFNEYNIPNSVNIKPVDILNSDLRKNQKLLFYGADDIAAAQAWFILKSAGYKGVYILKGGMNSWKNDILFPKRGVNLVAGDSIKFEKIKAISLHFGGSPQVQISEGTSASIVTQAQTITPPVPKLTTPAGTIKKKKEGC
jgi:rhodanese-related sulfurtransferase